MAHFRPPRPGSFQDKAIKGVAGATIGAATGGTLTGIGATSLGATVTTASVNAAAAIPIVGTQAAAVATGVF